MALVKDASCRGASVGEYAEQAGRPDEEPGREAWATFLDEGPQCVGELANESLLEPAACLRAAPLCRTGALT